MSRSPSYAGSVETASPEERAALVALLQTRPRGMRWGEITAQVVAAGSPLDVWHRLVPPALVPPPREADPLEAASQDTQSGTDQGHTVITLVDGRYPERLRPVHQAPAVLFARRSAHPRDSAVSV